jgi:hypothetical protein
MLVQLSAASVEWLFLGGPSIEAAEVAGYSERQAIEKCADKGIVFGAQNCLLTSALDGNVRVWVPAENPVEGQVVDPSPAYQHPVEDEFEMHGKRRVCACFSTCPPPFSFSFPELTPKPMVTTEVSPSMQ